LTEQLHKSSAALVLVMAATAVAGYGRELVLASYFGVGGSMDAFFLTLAIVQSAVDLLFIGTLTATVVPLLSGADASSESGTEERARLLTTAVLVAGLAALLLAGILWAFMPAIIDAIAPGMRATVRASAARMGNTLVWLVPMNALLALLSLALNARQWFIFAAIPYLGCNVVFIIAIVVLTPVLQADALPIACLAGPAVFLPIVAARLARLGLLQPGKVDLTVRSLAPLWRLSRPNLLSAGIGSSIGLLMVSHLAVRAFAADRGEGVVAALGYAYKLYEVPMSLIVNPTAIIVFPMLAAMHLDGRPHDFGRACRQLLAWGMIVLFPVAVLTWAGADQIVGLLLRRGRFDLEAARMTADALRGFAPAIAFEAVVIVLFRAFLALRRPGVPVIVSMVALVSLVGLLAATAGGSVLVIALSLSGAFAVAALALIAILAAAVGRRALPEADMATRWAIAALAGLGAWRLAGWGAAGSPPLQIAAAAIFLTVYLVLLLALLPDYRAHALGAIRSGLEPWTDRAKSP
jgi:putative peptidoglycan lipid II flippase